MDKIVSALTFKKNIKTIFLAALFSAATALYGSYRTYLFVLSSQSTIFTDIVAGPSAWNDFNKSPDYFFFFAYPVIFFISYAAAALAAFFSGPDRCVCETRLAPSGPSDAIENGEDVTGNFAGLLSALVSAALAVLSLRALTIALKIAAPEFFVRTPARYIFLGFSLVVFSAIILASAKKLYEKDFLSRISELSQLFLPLLLLAPCDKFLVAGEKGLMRADCLPFAARFAIYAAASCLVAYNVLSLGKNPRSTGGGLSFFTFGKPALFSAAFFLSYPVDSVLFLDEFHLGEIVLPWDQIMRHGLPFYDGFVPVQGLLEFIYGGFSELFLGGGLSGIANAHALSAALFSAVTALLVASSLGAPAAMLFALSGFSLINRMHFLPVLVLVLIQEPLVRRPFLWLAACAALSAFHIAYIPTIGLASLAAVLPAAMFFILYSYLESRRCRASGVDGYFIFCKPSLISLILVIALIAPAAPFFMKIAGFVKINASSNSAAYATPAFEPYDASPVGGREAMAADPAIKTLISLNLLRADNVIDFINRLGKINHYLFFSIQLSGWIVGIPLIFALMVVYLAFPGTYFETIRISFIGIFSLFFLVAITPYSWTRVDPGILSRSGHISIFIFYAAAAVAIAVTSSFQRDLIISGPRITAMTAVVSVLFAARLIGNITLFYESVIESVAIRDVRSSEAISSAGSGEFPKIGNAVLPAQYLGTASKLKKNLDIILKPGETYYDLTNRSIYYFILDRKSPTPYPADYLAANDRIQELIVERLEKENPPAVWISPAQRFDGGPASIRSYRVYKWLMDHSYRYYGADGLGFLVKSERLAEKGIAVLPGNDEAKKLAEVFHKVSLERLPASWGRSMQERGELFARFRSYSEKKDSGEIMFAKNTDEFNVEVDFHFSPPIDPRTADFICMNASFEWFIRTAKVYWAAPGKDFSEERSFFFLPDIGLNLIPVGSSPYWRSEGKIGSIRFTAGQKGILELRRPEILCLTR